MEVLISIPCFIVLGILGIGANFLLLLAVYKNTPKTLSNYAILIANSAVLDLLGALACILTIPRQNMSTSSLLLIFDGPCNYINKQLCWASFSELLSLFLSSIPSISGFLVYSLVLSHYLLCTSFAFRLYVVIRGRLSKTNICASLVLVNAFNLLVFYGIFNEFQHTHDSIYFAFENNTIGIFNVSERFSTQLTLVFIIVSSPIVFAFCLFMRRRIVFNLEHKKLGMSTNSHMMHRMLLRALRAQLLISFIASLGSSLLLLSIFNVLRSPFLNFVQLVVNCSILIVSPVVNLSYVKPYREYILYKWLSKHNHPPAISTSKTNPAWSTTFN